MSYLPSIREHKEHESPIGQYRVAMGLTVAEFCKKACVHITDFVGLQNGMLSPIYEKSWGGRHGLKPCAKKICDLIGLEPEVLFPRYFCKLTNNEILTQSQIKDIYYRPQTNAEEAYCLKQAINKAIDMLDENLAEVIRLHYLEGLTYEEIGEMRGCTRQYIDYLHKKAMRILRSHKALSYLKAYQN